MQNNKKRGFTLSEVLISIAIIGVIMALSVNSIRIVRASYISMTYFAFENLKAMVMVLYAGSYAEGTEAALEDSSGTKLPAMTRQCIHSGWQIINVLKTDDEYNSYNTPFCKERDSAADSPNSNLFCKSLALIANTSGTVNCSDLAVSGFRTNENGYNEPYIESFDYNSPNFITTNGQRFYITGWTKSSNVSSEYGYRLVGIDLNATSKPNIAVVSGSKLPDIVTFLVLDNGEVFPLGVAADNYTQDSRVYQYLNSKVKGYYYYDPDSDPNSEYTTSQRSEINIPAECNMKTSSGTVKTCNYSVVPIQNNSGTSFFSYREAYCTAIDDSQLVYSNYCRGISKNSLCPLANSVKNDIDGTLQSFDLCQSETVKPVFRYNF